MVSVHRAGSSWSATRPTRSSSTLSLGCFPISHGLWSGIPRLPSSFSPVLTMANGSWTERLGDIDLRTPSSCPTAPETRWRRPIKRLSTWSCTFGLSEVSPGEGHRRLVEYRRACCGLGKGCLEVGAHLQPRTSKRRVVVRVAIRRKKRPVSGRRQSTSQTFGAEIERFSGFWTRHLRVRDREAPGSNPGPPTKFVFKIGDFWRRPEPTGHGRGTDSPGTRRLRPVLRCARTVDHIHV